MYAVFYVVYGICDVPCVCCHVDVANICTIQAIDSCTCTYHVTCHVDVREMHLGTQDISSHVHLHLCELIHVSHVTSYTCIMCASPLRINLNFLWDIRCACV